MLLNMFPFGTSAESGIAAAPTEATATPTGLLLCAQTTGERIDGTTPQPDAASNLLDGVAAAGNVATSGTATFWGVDVAKCVTGAGTTAERRVYTVPNVAVAAGSTYYFVALVRRIGPETGVLKVELEDSSGEATQSLNWDGADVASGQFGYFGKGGAPASRTLSVKGQDANAAPEPYTQYATLSRLSNDDYLLWLELEGDNAATADIEWQFSCAGDGDEWAVHPLYFGATDPQIAEIASLQMTTHAHQKASVTVDGSVLALPAAPTAGEVREYTLRVAMSGGGTLALPASGVTVYGDSGPFASAALIGVRHYDDGSADIVARGS